MSQERRKRQQEKQQEGQPNTLWPKIAIIVIVIAIVAGLLWFLRRKQSSHLDAFAHCLSDKQAKMYGAYWCPHCADQKEMFGSSFQYVPYVECGVPGSHDEAQVCKDAGIKHFPTWQFADPERVEGTLALQTLAAKTGCS